MYPVKTFLTMAFAFIENKQLINKIYLYYYLKSIEEHLISLGKGTAQPCISMEKLKSIKIPIPSLEHQKKIIKYLDFIYEKTNKTSLEKIQELKMLNELCLNNQKMYGDNLIKTLGEVCKVNQGTYIKPDMKIQGEYPVYGGGNASYYINQYNREDDIIVAKDGVSTDCVRYEKNKFFLNHHGWTLICKEQIIKKYMFYYLQLIQPELLSIAKGTAQLGINQENFYNLKIHIPSLEQQQKIVDYLDFNNNLIDNLNKEIENNKKQAQLFITGIVKAKVQDQVQDNNKLVDEDKEEDQQENIIEPKTKVEKLTNNGKKPLVENNID